MTVEEVAFFQEFFYCSKSQVFEQFDDIRIFDRRPALGFLSVGLDAGFAVFLFDDGPGTTDTATDAAHPFKEVAIAVTGENVIDHGFAAGNAIGFAGLDGHLAVRIQLGDGHGYGFGNAAGIGIADTGLGCVGDIFFFHPGQIDIGDGKQVTQFLIGQDIINGTGDIRFFAFGFFSKAWTDEYGLGIGMQCLYRAASGYHGGKQNRGHLAAAGDTVSLSWQST